MKEFNGHRSWNQWNVSLWLSNDESLEYTMREYKDKEYSKNRMINALKYMIGDKTPDGATINRMAIRNFVESHSE